MKYFIGSFLVWMIYVSSALSAESQIFEPGAFPSLMTRVHIREPLEFCGEKVDLGIQEVKERFEKEMLLTLWNRPQVILWIKRSARYLPIIEKMLSEKGMPDDLKYIAIVESALRPHASSNKGAVGFWQFISATGRKYGLTINSEKDERRNIFRSSEAAINYLKMLYETFGSWTLAAAAYNMGEQGLQSEILAQNTNNYYYLYLPLETQRYVFRILSAKLILTQPETYGFQYTKEDVYPPLEYDSIKLECFQEIPIAIVAQAADTHFKAIKDLNPELRGHFLAAGRHSLLVPKGAEKGFQVRFNQLVNQWVSENNQRVYVVKEGDSLSAIAERFNVPLPALIIWNRLDNKKHIHPGDRLVIYPDQIESDDQDRE
ncbi:MAG: transglycosylase SLT domain-containing protein [Desulfobacterales bacterium]|jgi:hypothetical protein